jgi:hypothetical protein
MQDIWVDACGFGQIAFRDVTATHGLGDDVLKEIFDRDDGAHKSKDCRGFRQKIISVWKFSCPDF